MEECREGKGRKGLVWKSVGRVRERIGIKECRKGKGRKGLVWKSVRRVRDGKD